jgi:hypothetical protein
MSNKMQWFLILILLFWIAGCTTVHGVKPIYPKIYGAEVSSTQLVFKWKPSPEPDISYDLVIYERLNVGPQNQPMAGRVVYYREGIRGTEHMIEEFLRPNSEYYWSLRTRRDGATSAWSNYDFMAYFVIGHVISRNVLFSFKTR